MARRGPKPRPLAERFWAKIQITEGCWIWHGSKGEHGYGQIQIGARGMGRKIAHRLAYEMLVGPIAQGLELDHICRVRACVNPDHLEAVTHRENVLRGDRCKRPKRPITQNVREKSDE